MSSTPVVLPRHSPAASLRTILLFLVIVVGLAVVPLFVRKPYILHMWIILFLAITQGEGWNVIGGYTGQHSVGHAAYFGVGAYGTMMLLEVGRIAPWWGIWGAIGCAILVSIMIGSVTFRLRGPYFVLASIAVTEIIRLAALYFKDFTRGAEGFLLSEIPTLHLFGAEIEFLTKRPFFYAGLAVAAAAVLVNYSVQHSKLGYYLQAIREDQDAAHALGINLWLYKNIALAISAVLTAAAGGLYAMYVKFIDPNSVFALEISVQILLLCIIGGIGTILGPVIGSMVLVPLSEFLRNPKGLVQVGILSSDSSLVAFIEAHLSNAHVLIYGILVVLVILFAPDGVLGVIRSLGARVRRRLSARRRVEAVAS